MVIFFNNPSVKTIQIFTSFTNDTKKLSFQWLLAEEAVPLNMGRSVKLWGMLHIGYRDVKLSRKMDSPAGFGICVYGIGRGDARMWMPVEMLSL